MRYGASFPVRVRFTKHGRVRFVGHRDVARAFERAFRIEALPLAFTEGFSPRPKVSFGLALSTGYESDDEYLDVSFADAVDVDAVVAGLAGALPEGITVVDGAVLRDGAPALQEAVTAVDWELTVADADGAPFADAVLAESVAAVLAADELVVARTRKGRTRDGDVRPAIRGLEAVGGSRLVLAAEAQPQSVKPVEVLTALAQVAPALGTVTEQRVLRKKQWIERDGARLRPLDADPRPRVPEARAS